MDVCAQWAIKSACCSDSKTFPEEKKFIDGVVIETAEHSASALLKLNKEKRWRNINEVSLKSAENFLKALIAKNRTRYAMHTSQE